MIDAPVMATAAATTKGLDCNVVLRGFEALFFSAVPGAGFFAAAPGARGGAEPRTAGRLRAVSLGRSASLGRGTGGTCASGDALSASSDSGCGRADCSTSNASNSTASKCGGRAKKPV